MDLLYAWRRLKGHLYITTLEMELVCILTRLASTEVRLGHIELPVTWSWANDVQFKVFDDQTEKI